MAPASARSLIEPGTADTLGARPVAGGVNFAVYAPAAQAVSLCLFNASGHEIDRHELPACTDGIWHGFRPGIGAGQHYGFRAHGDWAPEYGLRFNDRKLLLDPYARELAGAFTWHDAVFDFDRSATTAALTASTLDSAPFVPRSVVTAPMPAVGSRERVLRADALLYELHVRGYTMRHPALDPAARGRFDALGHPDVIAHLQALGVSCVELMPIQAFVDEEFLVRKGLRNFWGYNTIAFFCAEPRYRGAGGVDGLRQAVDALHAANIEVVLDVVYNHTAEGGHTGPTFSFRGLANADYYRLQPDAPGEYINDTGCGNTLNPDAPIVRRLIIDNLRYWVSCFGVDGFRFDLATVLGRTTDGFTGEHPIFREIRDDPLLRQVRLIAEPWDVGPGGYQLGGFPADWAEWNDQYRDAARRFWRGDTGSAAEFARRIHGSADIFEGSGRGPDASVNFVASHDGFTLADLVSYADRHNEANGEDNRDGHEHNFSCNYGIEGPAADRDIKAQRRRHRVNLLATLLLSQGTPMLRAGDEFGQSQRGNNNAYAQDNEIGWLDWSGLAADPDFFDAICELARLRRDLPLLRQAQHRHGTQVAATGLPDILWFDHDGEAMQEADWHVARALGLLLARTDDCESAEAAVAVLFNADTEPREFRLPAPVADASWTCRYRTHSDDTADAMSGPAFRLTGPGLAVLSFFTD